MIVAHGTEGHKCILVGTHGVDHQFHIIALAISSHEDEEAFTNIFEALVSEVESVVHHHALHGLRV